MPTANQLVRKGRKRAKGRKQRRRHLQGAPQRRGVVTRSYVINPRKPNSAERKVARVRFSDGSEVTAYFPGEGGHVAVHSDVLVTGGNRPDLPGVKYRIVRGVGGAPREETGRTNGRSRFGGKKK